jgi:uncharacterized RDD family membrane protein YckC
MSSADKLTIQTPEQTSLEFPLAGIGSRFLALAIDYLLQAAGYWVLAMIAIAAFSLATFAQRASLWTMAALVFVFFSIQLGYFAIFETIWNGQTPGKRWTHLRVIKDSGRPISAYDAILRNLLRIVDILPSLYATGVITMLISSENKRVGDYAAGTVVVHEKPLEGLDSVWNHSSARVEVLPVMQVTQLTVEELRLVETFLDRRQSLAPDVRWSMARQIAAQLGERLKIPAEARPDSEKFLETLAEQRRNTARFH